MIAARRRAEKPAASGTAALACVADEVTRETVARAFAQLGWSDAQVVEGDLAAAAKRLEQGPAPALLLLDVGDGAGAVEALQSMAELCTPETRVLAIVDDRSKLVDRSGFEPEFPPCEGGVFPLDDQPVARRVQVACALCV